MYTTLVIGCIVWVALWGLIGYLVTRRIVKNRREQQEAQLWMMTHPFGYLTTLMK